MKKILTRNFVLALFAQLVFLSVFYLLLPTLPIFLSRSGSTGTDIGVLIGIYFFSSLVLRPFIGKALLKIPEKKFMIAGALLFALTSVGYLFAPPFWPFLIVRLLQGIGFAFFHTASYTMIANISPKAQIGQSLSYFYLGFNLSGALAPPLGIFLINHFSFTHLFLTCLGLSLCSLLITVKLERRQAAPLQDSSNEDTSFVSWDALPPSIVSLMTLFIWGAITAFFPLYAINHGVTNPGLFFTTIAVMLILGRTLGGKMLDLYSKERIILPCLTTYIISMVILTFSKTLPMFILTAVIWGMGHAFLGPTLAAYALDRSSSSRGSVIGTFMAMSDLGMSLGPVIMGIVLHKTNYSITFLCLVLASLINLNYFYFFVRKKEPSNPPVLSSLS